MKLLDWHKVVGFWFLAIISLNAQSDRYSISVYNDESGLPQNSVKEIIQDSLGYYWLATESGVVRYDGQSFKNYDGKFFNTSSTRFYAFEKDEKTGGIYALNEVNEYVNIYTLQKEEIDSTNPIGLQYYLKFVNKLNFPGYQKALASPRPINIGYGKTFFVVPGVNNEFFLCFSNRIVAYKDEKKLYEIETEDLEYDKFFLISEQLVYEDKKNRLWKVGENGLTELNFVKDGKKMANSETNWRVVWSRHSPSVLIKKNNTMFKTDSIVGSNLYFSTLIAYPEINFENIYTFYESPKGKTFFIGSITHGLMELHKQDIGVAVTNDSLPLSNVYYGVFKSDSNTILTPKGKQYRWTNEKEWDVSELWTGEYGPYNVIQDTLGYTWVTYVSILYQLDQNKEVVQEWRLGGRINGFVLERGRLWFSVHMKGVHYVDIYALDKTPKLFINLPSVTTIKMISDTLAFMGGGDGLYKVNLETKESTEILELNGKNVRSLYYSEGDLWITTYNSGIYLYSDGDVIQYPVDNEGHLYTAHCIFEDKLGYFWITTNKGLYKVLKQDLIDYKNHILSNIYFYYFNKQDGLSSNEFNGGCQPCVTELDNGNIVFPSMDGLVYFNPLKVLPETPSGSIMFDEIKVNDELVKNDSVIHLGSENTTLSIKVSSPFIGNDRNLQIYYAFGKKGTKRHWITYPKGESVELNVVRPGDYSLYVRKLNGYGYGNYIEKNIFVKKAPRFYEAWYFYFVVSIVILLLFYFYLRYSTYRIQSRNSRLESEVQKRTQTLQVALTKLNESKNSLKKQIHVQEFLLGAMSHDVVTPLKYLIMMSQKIQSPVISKDEELQKSISVAMENSLQQIYKLMNGLLEFSKIEIKKEEISATNCNVVELVEEILSGFEIAIAEKKIQVNHPIKSNISVRSNPELLKIILTNLIDNAIKNSFKGEINILYKEDDSTIVVSIVDQGGGVPDDIFEWVNSTTVKQLTGVRDELSSFSGLGLFIVKQLTDMLKAKVWIERLDDGSQFNVLLNKEGHRLTFMEKEDLNP